MSNHPLKITAIHPLKALHYLKAYRIDYLSKTGQKASWELVSRMGQDRLEEELMHQAIYSDGAIVFATDPNKQLVVLLKEYRVSAGRFIYTLPAGLCDPNESIETTATREFLEETGLAFQPIHTDPARYTSVGIINERVNVVYGFFQGTPSMRYQSDHEYAEVIIADKAMVEKILAEQDVPVRTALLLQHFFKTNPFMD